MEEQKNMYLDIPYLMIFLQEICRPDMDSGWLQNCPKELLWRLVTLLQPVHQQVLEWDLRHQGF